MSTLQAVIQAGGKGTRLAPYSTVLPKALMPVGEGTVIDQMLSTFARGGVSKVYVTVSKFGPLIRSYCGDGSRWNLAIEYVEETSPLGTIGPLVPIRRQLSGTTFLVANSDVCIDLDVPRLLAFHRERGAALTVVVIDQQVKIAYGVLDQVDGRVVDFREKPTQNFCVSTGVYVMEPTVFDHIPDNRPYGFDDLVRAMLDAGAPIAAYAHPGHWIDIGRIEDLRRAQEQAAGQLMARADTQDD